MHARSPTRTAGGMRWRFFLMLEWEVIMDAAFSFLISVGIVAFGIWIVAGTITRFDPRLNKSSLDHGLRYQLSPRTRNTKFIFYGFNGDPSALRVKAKEVANID